MTGLYTTPNGVTIGPGARFRFTDEAVARIGGPILAVDLETPAQRAARVDGPMYAAHGLSRIPYGLADLARPWMRRERAKVALISRETPEQSARVPDLTGPSGSWVVVRRDTGESVCELFADQRHLAGRINPGPYVVLTALAYLSGLNRPA
jgi:hypothetical protein